MRRWCCAGALAVATALLACGFTAPGERELPSPEDAASDVLVSGDASMVDVVVAVEGSTTSDGGYRAAVLADTPLLYYRLEEAAGAAQVVSEVAGSPAAAVKAKPTLGAPSKPGLGKAASFNGTDAFLEVADDATQFLGVVSFTLEAWVFPLINDNTYRHVFIRDSNDQMTHRNEYGVWLQSSKLGFERYSDGNAVKAVSAAIPLNVWHHVVAVYDGANVALWLNGAQVALQGDTGQMPAKEKPLRFGSRDPSAGQFKGTIDEIAVYDHVLSPERIKAHFQAAPQ